MRLRYSNSNPPSSPERYFRFAHRDVREPRRSPLLERLLARADGVEAVSDWRREAFDRVAPRAAVMPGIGAAALRASQEGDLARPATVFLATAVSYRAEISNVRLADAGIIALEAAEAALLVEDFNRSWKDPGQRLLADRLGRLYLVLERSLDAATRDPEEARGLHIHDFLPSGDDGRRLRGLMSEMEMWLYDHEVNRRRAEAGLPSVSGLWLWGGGAALEALPHIEEPVAGDDVLFQALASQSPRDSGGVAPTVVAVSARPGDEGWREVETRWLEPAVADLRGRRIEALRLSADGRCYRVSARGLRRFWRRARPWWEYFE